MCSSDGRRCNRMALQSHTPSKCQQFNQPRSHVETMGLTDSTALGLMTARRSRPQEKKKVELLCA